MHDHRPPEPSAGAPPWAAEDAARMAALAANTVAPAHRPAAPAPTHGPRPRHRSRWVAAAAVLALAAAGVAGVRALWPSLSVPGRPSSWPAAPAQAATTPLGTPAPLATTSDSYAFLQTQPGSADPVAWDPCRPVHYVVRTQSQPDGGAELLAGALAEVSAATGLVFVDDGTTDEAPSRDRPLVSEDLYGDRWAPVLIAWESADENPDLAGDAIGEAVPVPVTRPSDGLRLLVSGQVRLDARQIGDLIADPSGYERVHLTLIHELGHLVGLEHVEDPSQVMYPDLTPGLTGYAAGDLTGLAAVGRGRCAPDV